MLAWRSAVSYDAASIAALVRESLDGLGYRYATGAGEKAFTENVLVVGIPRATATYRFEVEAPGAFRVDVYDTRPSPGAILPFLEVLGDEAGAPAVRALLAEVARRAPRPPWRFTFGQRLMLGLLSPDVLRARGAWRRALE